MAKKIAKKEYSGTLLGNLKKVSSFFKPFFKEMGWYLIMLLGLGALLGISSSFTVWAKGALFDALTAHDEEMLVLILGGLFAFFYVKGLSRNRLKYETLVCLSDKVGQYKLNLTRIILGTKVEMYSDLGSSQILSRINMDVLVNLIRQLPYILVCMACGLIGLVYLSIQAPILLPFTVIYLLLYFVFSDKHNKRSIPFDTRVRDRQSVLGQLWKDAIVRFEDIHLQGTEDAILKKIDTTRKWSLKSLIDLHKLRLQFGNRTTILSQSYNVVTYIIGAWLAFRGDITVGDLTVMISLNNDIKDMTESICEIVSDLIPELTVYVNRIQEITNYGKQDYGNKEADAVGNDPLSVILRNIKFTFKKGEKILKEVLKGVSMTLEQGKVYGIVGMSGAGKTTLVKLICRLLTPLLGVIRVNGIKIEDFSRKALTQIIGMVSQQSLVFMGTVIDQFQYLPGYTYEKMVAACKMVGLHEDIMSRPEGYYSQIGENGIKLSGGQKQRLAIAVVILQNPRILIMDEATSAQDSETQDLIYKNLELSGFFKDKILIKIAHRLSTVCHSDKIYVLGEDGVFIGEGTHQELINSCEYYKKLVAFEKGDL
jgi:ABC-type bacteriocin/lantibiotic exporter with double-glycine peptidase domain